MIKRRYCTDCAEVTDHNQVNDPVDPKGLERVFWGIITLSFSELIRTDLVKCKVCGKVSRVIHKGPSA